MVGQKILMGCRFLDLPCWGAIPCLSGKEQEILPILGLFGGFWRYPIIKCFVGRNEEENSKFPKVINREKTRICREKLLNGRENTIYSRD